MTNLPINAFTGSINNQSTLLINARELHQVLQVKTPFHKWINRRLLDGYFRENLDFIGTDKFVRTEAGFFGDRETIIKDYHLTIDTAKHLCLMEHSEIGYQIRQQFIEDDNKMRALIPQLNAELNEAKRQLLSIPTFLRQNPQELGVLLTNARKALFVAHPECEKIVLYREMGLNNSEIAKLLDLGKTALENRLRKLFDLGLLQRRQTSNTQLALFQ
ncbi:antA/AntB antirepressor family protein [Avibacterium paragallinarum]|uniref:antA/AntB antirepressor family protein n=1 Tax=Avibacterium paragallinarum TaxID=728 RepID=UPI00397B49B7